MRQKRKLSGYTGNTKTDKTVSRTARILGAGLLLAVLVLAWGFWSRVMLPQQYRGEIVATAREYGLDPLLVAAIAKAESNHRPDVVSQAGAVGIMQLMPDTALWVAQINNYGVGEHELHDPRVNLRLGCSYYAQLYRKYDGNQILALAAYNGGPGNVDRWIQQELWDGRVWSAQDIPFGETRDYVVKVSVLHQLYRMVYGDWAMAGDETRR